MRIFLSLLTIILLSSNVHAKSVQLFNPELFGQPATTAVKLLCKKTSDEIEPYSVMTDIKNGKYYAASIFYKDSTTFGEIRSSLNKQYKRYENLELLREPNLAVWRVEDKKYVIQLVQEDKNIFRVMYISFLPSAQVFQSISQANKGRDMQNMKGWSLDDYRNIATIIAAIIAFFGTLIALIVYISNSRHQRRQRMCDNAVRYIQMNRTLFQTKFIRDNIIAMENGTLTRDVTNSVSERDFNELLGEIEYLALLTKNNILSDSINVYLFGWFAIQLQPLLTEKERGERYWDLAVEFLDNLKKKAEEFYKMTKEERDAYFNKKHFLH